MRYSDPCFTNISMYGINDRRSILEQMRLESLRGNWTKVRVGSRKINKVYLKEHETSVSRGTAVR